MKKKIDAKRLLAICCIMLMLSSMLMLVACGSSSGDSENAEKQITSLEELNGHAVYAEMGTANAQVLEECEALKDSEKLYATSNNDAIQKLVTNKADAYVCDELFAAQQLAKYDSLKALDESIGDSEYGFAFPQDTVYKDAFNRALAKLQNNGIVTDLENKWINADYNEEKTLIKQTWPGNSGLWHVAYDPDNMPMTLNDANMNPGGFDLDLILEIARELDYSVEFQAEDITAILAKTAAGEYDIGAAGITITEDRKDIVTFSDPYYNNKTVILVRNVGSDSSEVEKLRMTIGSSFHKVFIENDRYLDLLRGFKNTLIFVLISIISAHVFGVFLMLWKYSGSWFANHIIKFIQRFIQFIPGMIWLFIVYYIVFSGIASSGFIAAFVAFTIMFGNVVDFVLEDAVGQVDDGQREAAYAMGYGKYKALFKIYLPQALSTYLMNVSVEMLGLIKTTALVELVAVEDIQAVADAILNETQVPFLPLIIPCIAYVIIGFVVFKFFRYLGGKAAEKKNDPDSVDAKILKGKI